MSPYIVDGVLYEANDIVGPWVQERCGGTSIAGPYASIGVLDERGNLAIGALWFNRRDRDVEVAVAVADRRKITRGVLWRMLRYAFEDLGAERITAEIEADNWPSIKAALWFGFSVEGVKRKAGANGQDKVIFGLLAEEIIRNGQSAKGPRTDEAGSLGRCGSTRANGDRDRANVDEQPAAIHALRDARVQADGIAVHR